MDQRFLWFSCHDSRIIETKFLNHYEEDIPDELQENIVSVLITLEY